mmetsp:Transcript_10516/g.19674  ORF Transcript_10516/g.19674 Transcript_10516/m.19674 type:complete len:594 (+) Transcript_10516:77-1858(+)
MAPAMLAVPEDRTTEEHSKNSRLSKASTNAFTDFPSSATLCHSASVTDSDLSLPDVAIQSDIEGGTESSAEFIKPLSIWTWQTIGVPLNGFCLAFTQGLCMSIGYGFFLGYLGLEPYVLSSVQSLMKLPEVLLLPLGLMTDCFPLFGSYRKSYLILAWGVTIIGLLILSFRTLPPPYFCQFEDGSYNWAIPPCHLETRAHKNWFAYPLCLVYFGTVLGTVAQEGLLLEYSMMEPPERRGQIKAEMTMVFLAGGQAASVVLGFFMNGREYLGSFDWSLSFTLIMRIVLGMAVVMLLLTKVCVHEPRQHARAEAVPLSAHARASWKLVKGKALASVLVFSFVVQYLVTFASTAGPEVRSQWAGVQQLQQQIFSILSQLMMMVAVYLFKVHFLQSSWHKVFLIATVASTTVDMIPTFLTVFGVVRNQYFFLGELVLTAIPMAAITLVANLLIIEMAEPGLEGLCYGLIGTLQHASQPLATVTSNQIFGLFEPSLSNLENYVADTPEFRTTVAWSYVLTYGTAFLATACFPLLPRQKEEAQRRKREWGNSTVVAIIVLVVPSLALLYGVTVLILTSQPETACLRIVGGDGCGGPKWE